MEGKLSSVRREAETPPSLWVAKEASIGSTHTALDPWVKDNVLPVLHNVCDYNRRKGSQKTFREREEVATLRNITYLYITSHNSTTPRRRGGGGRWTSLHESTSVSPPLYFSIPLSIFLLAILAHCTDCTIYITLHYPHTHFTLTHTQ